MTEKIIVFVLIFIIAIVYYVGHSNYTSIEKINDGFRDIPLEYLGYDTYRVRVNNNIVCNIEKNNYEMIRCTTYREVEK